MISGHGRGKICPNGDKMICWKKIPDFWLELRFLKFLCFLREWHNSVHKSANPGKSIQKTFPISWFPVMSEGKFIQMAFQDAYLKKIKISGISDTGWFTGNIFQNLNWDFWISCSPKMANPGKSIQKIIPDFMISGVMSEGKFILMETIFLGVMSGSSDTRWYLGNIFQNLNWDFWSFLCFYRGWDNSFFIKCAFL